MQLLSRLSNVRYYEAGVVTLKDFCRHTWNEKLLEQALLAAQFVAQTHDCVIHARTEGYPAFSFSTGSFGWQLRLVPHMCAFRMVLHSPPGGVYPIALFNPTASLFPQRLWTRHGNRGALLPSMYAAIDYPGRSTTALHAFQLLLDLQRECRFWRCDRGWVYVPPSMDPCRFRRFAQAAGVHLLPDSNPVRSDDISILD